MWNDKDLLEKLKTRDSEAIYLVYEKYYPVIKKMIVENSGSSDEAKDIFQETVIIMMQNIKNPGFELHSSIKTYIYSISKNLWLKKIRDSKKVLVVADDLNNYLEVEEDVTAMDEISKSKYVRWLISKVPVHCQRIVKYIYFFKYSVETVAGKMGYNSTHTASSMKYKCLQQMKEVTKINPI
jgi:RNA polymerase sigma factor (sigma-70 family)